MVTDKNWFKENILCLLSNAVKYSHGGKVTLTITHVTGNLQIQVPWEDVKDEKQKEGYRFNEEDENKNENKNKLSNGGTIYSKILTVLSRMPSFDRNLNTYADTDADTDTDGDGDGDTEVDTSTNGMSNVHVGSSSLPAPQFFSQSMVHPGHSELHPENVQSITDELPT